MPSEVNRHGLSRDIPEDIKRKIRQACRFGCVRCGFAIVQYEHIDPEFKDAKEHDPERMALLCGSCEDQVSKGLLSKETVKEARTKPWALTKGRNHAAFDLSGSTINVRVGSVHFPTVPSVINVDGIRLLSIEEPEQSGGPFRISGDFHDDKGDLLFRITKNEWSGEAKNWDMETRGRRIIIRTKGRKIGLQILCVPPDGLVIERLDMASGKTRVVVDKGVWSVATESGARANLSGVSFVAQERIDILITGGRGIRITGGSKRFSMIVGGGGSIIVGGGGAPPAG